MRVQAWKLLHLHERCSLLCCWSAYPGFASVSLLAVKRWVLLAKELLLVQR
jgi:hypothetical protein